MVLSQDDFVQPENLIPRIKDRTDWEHPDSINWQAWQRAVSSNRNDCDYLILEGLFIFQESSLLIAADYNYYLTISKERFLKERKQETRWGKEPLWFIEHVWDSHFIHGLPGNGLETTQSHSINQKMYRQIFAEITS